MQAWLERIRRAYDLTVRQYHDGVEPLAGVPDDLRDSPELAALLEDANACNSGAPDNRSYLEPAVGKRFLDVGCAANLANHHLHRWESSYFGVDVSSALVTAMGRFVQERDIGIGGLGVAELAALPFAADAFDMASVIGVLEYCPADYVPRALSELDRVLNEGARLVLDIPNPDSSHLETMMRLEQCLQRVTVVHSRSTFEHTLEERFSIDRLDDGHVMLKFFCRSRK
jgi:SAM-dependent methyltransferase